MQQSRPPADPPGPTNPAAGIEFGLFLDCIHCGLCYIFCPDMAYAAADAEGYFIVDLFYCKGCGICAKECPTGAITMVEDER